VRRALFALGMALALVTGAAATAAPTPSRQHRVIVQGSSSAAAAAAVQRSGGEVLRRLDVVGGVAAELPADASVPGFTVTPDEPLRPQSVDTGDSGGSGTVGNVYRQETGATGLPPAQRHSTVALIDTGISDVGGLGAKTLTVPDPVTGEPAPCANFSSEAGDCADNYGHGTFLAGLIAGGGDYPGMDPDARLVSVKIAGRSGAADTSSVLAAIQWVVSFKDQLGIDVLNLSLGTDSNHDFRKDPLNRAVERAWRAGLVVVVAASNRGPAQGTISKPADDPLVVTVGAVDDQGTSTAADDTVAPFSGRGPVREGTPDDPVTVRKPDVVAPGVGLVSLTVPGSHIEQTAPPSSVGVAGYRRGSGTSQATAVVSGAVALLLERRTLTPDEVKAALYVGAHHMWSQPFSSVGAGIVDVADSLDADVDGFAQPDPRQDAFDGLDLSRGTEQVTSFSCGTLRAQLDKDAGCTVVSGQLTALATKKGVLAQPYLDAFDATAYGTGTWDGQSWYAGQWVQGQSWYGQSWYGQSWYGQSWYEDGSAQPSTAPSEGTSTDFGTVLPGSAWYGVWR
jgi:serine protease AprX